MSPRFTVRPASPRFRARVLCLAVTLAWGGPSLAVSAASLQASHGFHIGAGPLAQALNRLAEQSDTVLLYDASLTTGLQAPAVDGHLATNEALKRVLAGSGLAYDV